MELSYNIKIKTTEVESVLKKTDSTVSSDIYVDKKYGWLDYKIRFNSESDYLFKPTLISKSNLNTKTIFKTNTLDVLITNILIDSKPYFYKLNFGVKNYTKDSIIVDLNIKDVVEYNNELYTNSEFYSINSELDYVYTSKVLDISDCDCIYRPDYIEIEAPIDCEIQLNSNVFSPKIINQYSFYLPSFYIKNKNNNSIIQCIESDIKNFNSNIQVEFGDYLKYKSNDKTSMKILKDFNISFENETTNKNCNYTLSSHCFNLDTERGLYLILPDGSITIGDKNNYTFEIIKFIDVNNIDITTNIYKKLDNSFEDIRSFCINSYTEIDNSINSFGLTYNKIDSKIPIKNYINNISYTSFNLEKNPKLKSKVLKDNSLIFRKFEEDSLNTINYTQFENINYFI